MLSIILRMQVLMSWTEESRNFICGSELNSQNRFHLSGMKLWMGNGIPAGDMVIQPNQLKREVKRDMMSVYLNHSVIIPGMILNVSMLKLTSN